MLGRRGIGVWVMALFPAPRTIVQLLSASDHGLRVTGFSVTFQGVSNVAAPALVELLRQDDAGSMTSLVLKKFDDSLADSFDVSGLRQATTEPASGEVLWRGYAHQQGGVIVQFNKAQSKMVPAGGRIGIAVTATTIGLSGCGSITFEE